MKQTKNYLLNLMEVADVLSAKPLNENAEKIEEALLAQQKASAEALLAHQKAIAGKLMMATGSYTGNGRRSVTLQTPGFKAKALLLRATHSTGWPQSTAISLWLGQNIDTGYLITVDYGDVRIKTTIKFEAKTGELKWSIPSIPDNYDDVIWDGGPEAINNVDKFAYEWIAFGTAED